MSSSSPRAAQLPPAQIPLEQLPSASIAQLPPSIHVPPAVAYTATTTTTTTTTIPQQQQQQQHQLPLLASAKRGSDEMQTAQNTQAPPLQLSEKKLRRLEKNRLSARECRRRKREATEDMESEIYTLEGENVRLRLQLRIGEEAEENIGKEQEKVTLEIQDLLKSGASEADIYATIEDFKEKFADYGRDRRSAIEFHLANVERLLQPTQTTSVAMRALEGVGAATTTTTTKLMESNNSNNSETEGMSTTPPLPPDDADAVGGGADADHADAATTNSTTENNSPETNNTSALSEPKNLFKFLVNYLEVTPEQAASLKDSRWVARDLDKSLHTSMDVLQQLRNRLILCGNSLEMEFDNVRSVLTPTQAAKFLVWVADNRACMHMLNELWSRVYPDPSNSNSDDVDSNITDAAAAATDEDKKPEGKTNMPL